MAKGRSVNAGAKKGDDDAPKRRTHHAKKERLVKK